MSKDSLADQLEEFPHPREAAQLFGHRQAEQQFLDAYRSGRLHHAWIIAGPEGIGKATLAYRIAKFLFAHPRPELAARAEDLSVPVDHPAFTRVVAQGHADLMILRRSLDDKSRKLRTQIVVDDTIDVIHRLMRTSGEGGWRVCIVDAADDWNRNSANALLKTLEEPPARTLFLIVAHQPGRLLPTIRSRSRMLPLSPLSEADLRAVVTAAAPDAGREAVARAIEAAKGSARRALMLLDDELAGIGAMTRSLLDRLPVHDLPAIMALADAVAGRAADDAFAEFEQAVRDWLADTLAARAGRNGMRARAVAPLADIWDGLGRSIGTLDAYNLDRRPFILGFFSDMAEAMRRLDAA
ncbi:MAG: DNA polymerase III subunit delta' [Beijerinckiaceae bacterium]